MIDKLAIIICICMAILSATGMWKANKFGTSALWVIVAFLFYALIELTASYKAVVIMLSNKP